MALYKYVYDYDYYMIRIFVKGMQFFRFSLLFPQLLLLPLSCSHLPCPSLPSSSLPFPPNTAKGSGECYELPQWVWAEPGRQTQFDAF